MVGATASAQIGYVVDFEDETHPINRRVFTVWMLRPAVKGIPNGL